MISTFTTTQASPRLISDAFPDLPSITTYSFYKYKFIQIQLQIHLQTSVDPFHNFSDTCPTPNTNQKYSNTEKIATILQRLIQVDSFLMPALQVDFNLSVVAIRIQGKSLGGGIKGD